MAKHLVKRRSNLGRVLLLAPLFLGVAGCAGTPAEEPVEKGAKPAEAPDKAPEKAPAGSEKAPASPEKPAGEADKGPRTEAPKTPTGPIVPPAAAPAPAGEKPAERRAPNDPPDDGTGGGGGGQGGGNAGDPRMGDFVRENSLAEQERKELAKHYLKVGRALELELRYHEAFNNLERAHKLDPDNVEAKLEFEKCAWLVGDRPRGEYRDAVRAIAEERIVHVKQAKIEMERLFQEGQILVEKQRYDDAVQRFERVLESLRWFPYEIDAGGTYRKQTEDAIAKAKSLQSAQEQRRRELLQVDSLQEAEFQKAETVKYIEATLRALFKEAREAFENRRWEKCQNICDQILAKRPTDTRAAQLKAAAEDESRREFEIKSYENKVEHYRRQMEWVREDIVPYQEILKFPDIEAWSEVSRREVQGFAQHGTNDQSEDVLEINRRLESQKITLNFDQTPFGEAVEFLRDITGLNYVVATSAQDLIDNEGLKVSLRLRDITLKNALNLILATKDDLIYVIKNGVILITTKGGEKKQLFLDFYDVSDIINKTPDFPAPELGLPSNKNAGGKGGGMTGGVLSFGTDDKKGAAGTGVDADKLRDLVDSKLGEAADDGGSVEISGGVLIVRKTAEAHKKIQRLLEALRKTVGIMVTLESRFIDIQDNFLEQIGVDLANQPDSPSYTTTTSGYPPDTFGSIFLPRGNQGPTDMQVGYNFTDRNGDFNQRAGYLNLFSQQLGSTASNPFNIDNTGGISLQYNYLHNFQLQAMMEAIRKKQKARQINAPRVQCFNGQRAHMLSVRQRAYIQGVEVNQTGVIPVLNPVVGILNSGAILEVQPTVSYDKKYVTLEVKPTLAVEGQSRTPAPVTLANGNTSIPIELPVIIIQKIRSTLTCPDGGTVLIGGLKNFDEQEMESGVPFAMDVPIFKNLFRRQGFTNLKRSLVVLLKCNITIIRDEEVAKFGRKPQAP